MLKETVTYEDFNGNMITEDFYFNLTQVELIEMSMELPDGAADVVGNDPSNVGEGAALALLEKLGNKGILDFMKRLLLKAYGVKSEDGKRFQKSPELSKEFSETLAFDNLLIALLSDEARGNRFITGIIPASVQEKMPKNSNMFALPNQQ